MIVPSCTFVVLLTLWQICLGANKVNYQQEMRNFIQEISQFAKGKKANFQIVVENGIHLVNSSDNLASMANYLKAFEGVCQPGLNFGFLTTNRATPHDVFAVWKSLLTVAKSAKKSVLIVDYASDPKKIDISHSVCKQLGFIDFAADKLSVGDIPKVPAKIFDHNSNNINSLADVKNFLYLINPHFTTKAEFLAALQATAYDLLVIDKRFGGETITAADVNGLKNKHGGGKRLVFAYVPIGEADTTRKYWKTGWREGLPSFIGADYPRMSSNHKVKYWDPRWKSIIYSGPQSQMLQVVNTGFDGAFLDATETYVFYEDLEDELNRKKRMAMKV